MISLVFIKDCNNSLRIGPCFKFNKYLEISNINELKELCIDKGVKIKIKKGELLTRKGESTKLFGFIEYGAVKYMSFSSKGEGKVVGFSFSNDFVGDLSAFLGNHSSHFETAISFTDTQAIMDCSIYTVNYSEISILKDALIKEITRVFFIDIYDRLLSLYCDTAEERYLKLVKMHPNILNIATLRDIASFLSITPETLSRIRRRIILP